MDIKHLRELVDAYDRAAEARRDHLNEYTSIAYFQALRRINDAGGWERIARQLLAMIELAEVSKQS